MCTAEHVALRELDRDLLGERRAQALVDVDAGQLLELAVRAWSRARRAPWRCRPARCRAASSPSRTRRRPSTRRRPPARRRPAVKTPARLASAAATPTMSAAVEMMPSLAPSTAARSHPARWLRWRSTWAAVDGMWSSNPASSGPATEAGNTVAFRIPNIDAGCVGRSRAGAGWALATVSAMLKLVLPKGSLEKATLELFEAADLRVHRELGGRLQGRPSTTPGSTRSASCARRRSRPTWPRACSTSASPAGTGSRRPAATSSSSASCSTRRPRPTRPHRRGRARRLAVADGRRPARRACGSRASTRSSPGGTSPTKGIDADIRLSYGATEAKVPDIVDCIVDITETGRALRAAGLKIIDDDPHVLHRADRQPGGLRRPREAPRHGADPHPARGRARGPRQGAGEAQRAGRPTSTR